MKNELRTYPHKVFISQQNLQQFFRALRLHGKLRQHFFHGRDRQAGIAESLLDFSFSLRFFRLQLNLRSRPLHEFALHVQFLLARQFFECRAKRFRSHTFAQVRAQILSRDSRRQRILPMKPFHPLDNFPAHLVKCLSTEQSQSLR